MSVFGSKQVVMGTIGLAMMGGIALSGCQNDQSPPPASAAPSNSAAPSTAPSTAPSSPPADGGGGPSGAQAQPGQLFQIGQAATIPFTSGSSKGTLALTVTKIEQGTAGDLTPLKLGDKVKGMVPYYIHYTVKNVGTTDLSFTSASEMKGLLPDGSEAQEVDIIGDFAKCPNNSAPSGFSTGKTYTDCVLALAPNASTKVAGAEWWGDPYTLGKGVNWGVKASS